MYELRGVTKRYWRGGETVDALAGVDLVIGDGHRLVVQGPAGSGKSTLLQLLGGLGRPTSGSVELDGTDLAALPEARRAALRAESIGFVSRSCDLDPALSVRENVESVLVPLGFGAAARRARVADALESVGLGALGERPPTGLCRGGLRRVAIARALVKRPKVLLADEPTGDLEGPVRDEIMELLEGLWKAHGLTFVMATHDRAVARKVRRLATIRGGRISVAENAAAE
ncbi:ABC transporter ATP-binding protein [Streptomyces sp. NPDC059002]|uniref:ABC transporter ATP-binding protein n=1 Tax=Streptomyces sp. NPDC059002 TaxID=3346690 RepID=UPI00369FC024